MKLLEKLLKTIFKLAGSRILHRFQASSIEKVLKKSIDLLDEQTLLEMKAFVVQQQTASGGFADKAGNSDLYYSLFGCYLAEALDIPDVMPSLKQYVKTRIQTGDIRGISLYCTAILHTKLWENESLPPKLKQKIAVETQQPGKQEAGYSNFLSLISFYYLENYVGLYRIQKQLKTIDIKRNLPCPVTAAHLVLQYCFGKPTHELEELMHSFYRGNGSFMAIHQAPIGDLLSTAVSLYALDFVKADLRALKPDCLNYVDSLYADGGFCATELDVSPDVEYTFYGLLALGALSTAVSGKQ